LKSLLPRPWRPALVWSLIVMVLIIGAATTTCGAETPKKIVILPLSINADQDLSFLQRGMQNMLASRLTVPGRMMPVERQKVIDALAADPSIQGPLPPSRAIALARSLGADYVVLGSLTVFGDSISTDAQVFDVAGGTPKVSFHQVGETQSEVIRHVDLFSADVNQTLLGIQPRQATAAAAGPASAPAPSSPDPRRHPESLLTPATAPAKAAGDVVRRTPSEPWISRAFKTELHGVGVGDVDGDGANEVVIIDQHTVGVYRMNQGKLVRVAEVKEKSHNVFLNVNVADINKNGRAEIFVTNLPAGNDRLRSFVLEWEGNGLKPILEKENWFYSVMVGPDGEATLYGQQKGNDISTFGISQMFDQGVYSLVWREGRYEKDLRQHLPRGGNILALAYGDPIEGSERSILTYSRDFRLNLFDSAGDEVWTSEAHQGSRDVYVEISNEDDFKSDNAHTKRIFLPHRILVADMNGNGKREVIVPYNKEQLTSLSRTKLFKNGLVQGLEWNGLNLAPVWKTESVAKFIADVNLGDVDNDGVQDVIYAVVNKTALTKKKQRSTLVVQRFMPGQ
jgi:hypothetical protein